MDTVIWQGVSGRTYELHLHPIGTRYYELPGIYIFCHAVGPTRWAPDYIGETENFDRRLGSEIVRHHQWPSICAAGATHICTMHVPGDLAARLAVETDLRHHYRTPCNDQGTRSVG